MRILELQDKDVTELITLIDFAVKSQGLSVATSAAVLLSKIQSAATVEDEGEVAAKVTPKKD